MPGFLPSSLASRGDFPLISVSLEFWVSGRQFQLKQGVRRLGWGLTSSHLASGYRDSSATRDNWERCALQTADEIVPLSVSYRLVRDLQFRSFSRTPYIRADLLSGLRQFILSVPLGSSKDSFISSRIKKLEVFEKKALYKYKEWLYFSKGNPLSKKSTHTAFCLQQSLSSCPVRPHYHITDCQFLSISAIVHSYLFQLQLVQSPEAKSFLQDWFQVDMQRKAAGQWAYFPSSSFCYDFRCEIRWWGGGWTDFLNWLVHWYENLLF